MLVFSITIFKSELKFFAPWWMVLLNSIFCLISWLCLPFSEITLKYFSKFTPYILICFPLRPVKHSITVVSNRPCRIDALIFTLCFLPPILFKGSLHFLEKFFVFCVQYHIQQSAVTCHFRLVTSLFPYGSYFRAHLENVGDGNLLGVRLSLAASVDFLRLNKYDFKHTSRLI